MISAAEVKVLDRNAMFYGVSTSLLMENAGKSVADFIIQEINPRQHRNILVCCGTGNNGGDGFVAARYLSKKYNTSVFLTGKEQDIKTESSRVNFHRLEEVTIKKYDITSLKKINDLLSENKIIIDAMLGTGLTGQLKEPYSTIVQKITATMNKTIVSVDIPTGLNLKYAIQPQYTITFHDVKRGMNKENSGRIVVADIGIPKKAVEYVGPGELSVYYPKPKKEAHKGDNGRVLIVGGGPYIGAPALTGFAALRTGSDLVYIATPRNAAHAITSFSPLFLKPIRLAKTMAILSPNLIVKALSHDAMVSSDDITVINRYIPKIDTVIIGPGLGKKKSSKDAAKEIILNCIKNKKSLVIDADAINVVGENPDIIHQSQTVVTPHAGEFKDLTGVTLPNTLKERKKTVTQWAKKLNVTILLKGQVDIISNGVDTKLNDIHNEAMTVGGTGDVLSGITGALLSKKVIPYNAARIAAFINGAAGNNAFKKHSYGLLATDVINAIPAILNNYL